MNKSIKTPGIQSTHSIRNIALEDMRKSNIHPLFNVEKRILTAPSNTDLIQIRL